MGGGHEEIREDDAECSGAADGSADGRAVRRRRPAAAKPEEVGFAGDRLGRIHETVQRYVDERALAGAVTMVARRGRIAHFEAHGFMDLEARTPMRKDAIFRIASMSKPVTGVAIMMLMEEGKLRLTDPCRASSRRSRR